MQVYGRIYSNCPIHPGRFVGDEIPPVQAEAARGPSLSTEQDAGDRTGARPRALSSSELTVAALSGEIFFLRSSDATATFAFLCFLFYDTRVVTLARYTITLSVLFEGRRSDATCKPCFHLSCFVSLHFSTPVQLHHITNFFI